MWRKGCRRGWSLAMLLACATVAFAQGPPAPDFDKKYTLAGLSVVGADYTDVQAVKLFSALQIGQELTIPGEEITRAIRNLWAQNLFEDISIDLAEVRDSQVYLVIQLDELPRLTRYTFEGVGRSEQETLKGKIDLLTGRVVNENVMVTARKRLREYYHDKGYWDADISIVQSVDTAFENGAKINISIDKGAKIKVGEVVVEGTAQLEEQKVLRAMKDLKEKRWYRILKSSKFVETNVEQARSEILALYNKEGYRNARFFG